MTTTRRARGKPNRRVDTSRVVAQGNFGVVELLLGFFAGKLAYYDEDWTDEKTGKTYAALMLADDEGEPDSSLEEYSNLRLPTPGVARRWFWKYQARLNLVGRDLGWKLRPSEDEPKVRRNDWGVVKIVSGGGAGEMGFYDDDQGRAAMVYTESILTARGCWMKRLRELRRPKPAEAQRWLKANRPADNTPVRWDLRPDERPLPKKKKRRRATRPSPKLSVLDGGKGRKG